MIKVSFQEWKFIGLIWLIIVFLTFSPIIIGIITTPADSVFLGCQTLNGGDLTVYYSNIEQVKRGNFLYKNLFTSEPHPEFIFDPFWFTVGLLAKISSLSPFVAFQLSRFLLIPILLIVAYYFVSFFFKEEIKRKICFIFLIFASGLGMFYIDALRSEGITEIPIDENGTVFLPLDIWVPEAFTFLSLHNSPHFIASLTLIIIIFLFSLLTFENYRLIYSLGAGFSILFLASFHPYHLPTIFIILGIFIVFFILKERKLNFDYLKHYFVLLVFSLPPVFYHLWALLNFKVRYQHFLQNITLTPHPLLVFLGYGFLLIFVFMGIYFILRKKEFEKNDIFLLIWVFTQPILFFSPLPFQRRLTAGFNLVLAILAVSGLFYLITWLRENKVFGRYFSDRLTLANKIILIYFFLLFFSASNFFLLINDFSLYLKNNDRVYLKKEVVEGMRWLKKNSDKEAVILSSPLTGNLIPVFAVRQVYFGHFHQTANSKEKLVKLKHFFHENNDEKALFFLKENKINYLFFGPEEKQWGRFNPKEKNYLAEVFSNKEVSIYRLKY